MREAVQAVARETLRLCHPSKATQAALELRAPAPRGHIFLGTALRKNRVPTLFTACDQKICRLNQ